MRILAKFSPIILALVILASASNGNVLGQGSGTINQLDQFKATTTPFSAITTNVAGKNIYIPYATATSSRLYATTFCINNVTPDCITAWPSGSGGSGTISTSTALVSGQVVFSTGVNTVGNDSTFLFDSVLDKLTTTNASTTNLTVGTAAYFPSGIWNSSGNVGIGTASPATTLDVNGVSTFRDTIFLSTQGLLSFSSDLGNGEGGLVFGSVASKGVLIRGGASGTGVFVNSSNNVGIGTTSPAYPLAVTGDINATGKYRVGATQVVYLPNQTNFLGTSIYGNGGTALSYTSGSDGRYNTAVGLGALEFNTTGNNNTALGYNALQDVTTGTYNVALGSNTLFQLTTGSYNMGIGGNTLGSGTTTSSTVGIGWQAGLNFNGDTAVFIGHQAGRSGVYYASSGATGVGYQSLYTGTGNYSVGVGYRAGFVSTGATNLFLGYQAGDNTTTGANNIIIGSNIDAPSATDSNQLNIGNIIFGTGVSGTGTTIAGNINIATTSALSARLNVQSTGTSDILNLFETGGAEVMTVLESGNVGVGVTNPAALFTVGGGQAGNAGFEIVPGSGIVTQAYNRTGGSYASLSFDGSTINFRPSGTSALFIDTSRNVGIGTTSPLARLSVKGAGVTTGKTFQTTDSTDLPQFTILDNGYTGIGTTTASTNPAYKLVVDGDIRITNSNDQYGSGNIFRTGLYSSIGETPSAAGTIIGNNMRSATTTTDAVVRHVSSDPGQFIRLQYNRGITFHTNATPALNAQVSADLYEVMRIGLDGYVGIGTTSPMSMLGVAGTITANNINATSTSATSKFSGILQVITRFIGVIGAAFTPTTEGEIGIDTTSNQFKFFSNGAVRVLGDGNFYPSFTYATSTAWTATTTIPLGPAYTGETWNGVKCFTDTGTLNVSFYDGTNRMNMFNASTTVGTVGLVTNNTFTADEKRYVDVGTPASSPTRISCTVSKSLTPN